MASIYDWSTTAASNATADSGINWQEGQAPSTVNNSGRQMMGRVAEFSSDLGGLQTFGGTANALSITAASGFTTYSDGLLVGGKAASSNTGAAMLDANGIGAKAIRKITNSGDAPLAAGDIQANAFLIFRYNSSLNSSAGGWQILNTFTDTSSLQPLDATLTALAGVTTAANQGLYATGADAFSTFSLTSTARTLLDDTSISAMRTTLGLTIGSDVQAYQAPQSTATWEAGTGTTESETSPAKVKAAIDALAPSHIKAWVNFNGVGTVTIRDSYNVHSIGDNGVGDYTIFFATALANANYVAQITTVTPLTNNVSGHGGIHGTSAGATTKTTSSLRIATGSTANGALADYADINVVIIGS